GYDALAPVVHLECPAWLFHEWCHQYPALRLHPDGQIFVDGAMPSASGGYPESAHHPGYGIDAVPRLLLRNVYAPARQYAHLQDDHHKPQKVKSRQYQSSCYRPDVFYAVRADALLAFSSALPAIRLFSALRAALGSNAFPATPDQTSLWAAYAPDLAVHPDQRSRYHQNSLSWRDRTCRNSARP